MRRNARRLPVAPGHVIKKLAALTVLAACAHMAHADPKADDLGQLIEQKSLASRIGDSIHRASNRAADLVLNAMGSLGVPYRFGGTSAETGFDCSGFVRAMFQQTLGTLLPRTSAEQAAATDKIKKDELRPGDLVFFNTMRRAYSHVGIYVGEGKFIHAPRTGAQVRVESMNVGYWQHRFDGARRVLTADANASAAMPASGGGSAIIGRESPAPSSVRLGGSLFGKSAGDGAPPSTAFGQFPASGDGI